MASARIERKDMKRLTLRVTIAAPINLLLWLGVQVIKLGAWIAGFGVKVENTRQGVERK